MTDNVTELNTASERPRPSQPRQWAEEIAKKKRPSKAYEMGQAFGLLYILVAYGVGATWPLWVGFAIAAVFK